ncbi:hypothetical protein I4U23_002429 [Adineta vaga]|nr:hypothetical protein I4U23_002429 [Adineta vaga]
MFSSGSDLRKEFLAYLHQSDSCELFYNYMKSEQLDHILEFYLACDELKNLTDEKKTQRTIIELIYKHYLSNGKSLSSKQFSLPYDLFYSIKQRLNKREFHSKFYEHAQEYVLKYMLQMCYPKFLIEQQNVPNKKRQALDSATFTPMHRRCVTMKKKDVFDKFKQQTQNTTTTTSIKISSQLHSFEGSSLIQDNSKQLDLTKNKSCDLAQRNPMAFFEEIKRRLVLYQIGTIEDDDSLAILDLQIAQTIDDADNYLYENTITNRNQSTRCDSGFGTDISERNYELTYSRKQRSSIDVVWYSSLDSKHVLLSTIPYLHKQLTFKEFRQLFKKQITYRYFFKTICTPDINKEQYVYRELTMDDELVPFYDGKIFVQLDQIC